MFVLFTERFSKFRICLIILLVATYFENCCVQGDENDGGNMLYRNSGNVQNLKNRGKKQEGEQNLALWLGPRLGRRRRSLSDDLMADYSNEIGIKMMTFDQDSVRTLLDYGAIIIPLDDSTFLRPKRKY